MVIKVRMKECTIKNWEKNTRNLNWSRVRVHDKLVSIIKEVLDSGKILEVGAQTGIDAEHLASFGYDITTIDYNDESIRLLKRRKNIKVVKGDALNMQFPDSSFDLVYSQGLIEHFKELELGKLIEEQKRVVKKGGYVVIDVPNTYSLNTIPKHILMILGKWVVTWETQYTYKQLRKLGESHGLRFLRLYSWGYDRYVGERARSLLGKFMNDTIERFEASKGHYFMKCIGIVFQKTKS